MVEEVDQWNWFYLELLWECLFFHKFTSWKCYKYRGDFVEFLAKSLVISLLIVKLDNIKQTCPVWSSRKVISTGDKKDCHWTEWFWNSKILTPFFLSQPFDIMGTYLYNLTLTNSWMFFKRIQYAWHHSGGRYSNLIKTLGNSLIIWLKFVDRTIIFSSCPWKQSSIKVEISR